VSPSAHTAGGRRNGRWDRGSIIEKICLWAERFDAPPCSADWNPSLARWRGQEWRIERYAGGEWPSTNAVKRHFGGSFDAAVIAAGFAPARPGPKPRVPLPAGTGRTPEVELAQLQRRLARAEARLAAAEARAGEARRRARLAGEREVRAKRARDRVAVVSETVEERIEDISAEAEARVRAALDQAGAATREMVEARRAAAASEARAAAAEARALAHSVAGDGSEAAERIAVLEVELRELAQLVCGERRRLTADEMERLRSVGPAGPTVLAAALRSLASARSEGDRVALTAALADVASAALVWRDVL
jgi:hypothetical protein